MKELKVAGLHPVVQKLLRLRGLDSEAEMESFLQPSYVADQHDPYLMQDMRPAVEQIGVALEAGSKIIIYGDYDIDGITATALMLEVITGLGGQAEAYIPDRFEEGYGISLSSLKKLKAAGAGLIISVDCGITAVDEVAWAQANGLGVVITDHHVPGEQLPQGVPILNPKRADDKYPFKDLAGVGVAFKLAQALQTARGWPEAGQEKWWLDLVALGTACDMVSLTGENRVLVKYGLVVFGRSRRPGLRALAAAAGIKLADVSTYHLGFILGPRLNAAGRLEHAQLSLELLTEADSGAALAIAEQLGQLNRQRRQEQDRIFKAAVATAGAYHDDAVLVMADSEWSHGIIGIVASKLAERFHRPVLLLQILGASAKGSGRSSGEMSMVEALAAAAPLLTKYGGHYFAAGVTLPAANIDQLRGSLNQFYATGKLKPQEQVPLGQAELEIESLGEVDWPLYEALSTMEPFGTGNPQPYFVSRSLKAINVRKIGAGQEHLKLQVADAGGKTAEVIAFGQAEKHPNLKAGQQIDICYQLSKNEYLGRSQLQLVAAEIK